MEKLILDLTPYIKKFKEFYKKNGEVYKHKKDKYNGLMYVLGYHVKSQLYHLAQKNNQLELYKKIIKT
jgi:hypothetical protein